jgi:hypothetical protein
MAYPHSPGCAPGGDSGTALSQRLERGEVIYFPQCPFALPEGEERGFLLDQGLGKGHKNIGYDPHSGRAGGFQLRSFAQAARLRGLLEDFSKSATAWLASVLPCYASAWQLDRVSYRPEEESTRRLGVKSRNDLLHVDAFPSRPTNGHRILRLFANVNSTEPRIWVTSEPFARLLERYGREVGLPTQRVPPLTERLRSRVLGIFQPARRRRSAYDSFMLRFHDFLKKSDEFQQHGPKRLWTFQPGSAWLVITDTASHAALRGRYALEHSYFIAPQSFALPSESPAALLERACGIPVLQRAA